MMTQQSQAVLDQLREHEQTWGDSVTVAELAHGDEVAARLYEQSLVELERARIVYRTWPRECRVTHKTVDTWLPLF